MVNVTVAVAVAVAVAVTESLGVNGPSEIVIKKTIIEYKSVAEHAVLYLPGHAAMTIFIE